MMQTMGQQTFSSRKWGSAKEMENVENLGQMLQRRLSSQVVLGELHDPFLLSGMKEAVERLQQAREQKERVMVYGDFDTDGITSTVILVHALQAFGLEVSYRIPDREKHGHGLHRDLLEEMADKNVSLIVTCDCGVNDQKEVDHATTKGMDVIITDHHTPDPDRFPEKAVAVLNPLLDDSYPEDHLSGSVVALKLVQALERSPLSPYLELAAIGLIADCVPLVGEGRIVAKEGLRALRDTSWACLQMFFIEQNIAPEGIDETTVGFAIAPRLNAASRLGNVYAAVQLFLGEPDQIEAKWQYLEKLNQKRKTLTQTTFDEALPQVEEDQPIQIVIGDHWKQGILGLVASRLCERFQQPVLVGRKVDAQTYGFSARSVEGFSMIAALQENASLCLSFGGHDGAAGCQVSAGHLEALIEALRSYAHKHPPVIPPLAIEAFVAMDILQEGSCTLLDILQEMAPFGEGNPRPLFGIETVTLRDIQPMGKTGDHFRLQGSKADRAFEWVAFFKKEWMPQLQINQTLDLLFEIHANHFQGERKLQAKVVDIRSVDSKPVDSRQ